MHNRHSKTVYLYRKNGVVFELQLQNISTRISDFVPQTVLNIWQKKDPQWLNIYNKNDLIIIDQNESRIPVIQAKLFK